MTAMDTRVSLSVCLTILYVIKPVISVSLTGFERVLACDDPTTFNGGAFKTGTTATATGCAVLCAHNTGCKAFSFRKDTTTCFLHLRYMAGLLCDNGNDVHYNDVYNPCLNGGDYNPTTDICQCYGGYLGNRCERIMTDCSDGESYYSNTFGVFLIHPSTAPTPFMVSCEMHYGGRTLMLLQAGASVNFSRTWDDYKQGFGSVNGDHWVGNDNIHYITTSRRHTLLVEINTPDLVYHQYYYEAFRVEDESDSYRVSFGDHFSHDNPANTLGDCLGPLKNQPFSTWDRDNDASTDNCAQDFRSGWWFKDCSECNPTGQYLVSPPGDVVTGASSDLHWYPTLGSTSLEKMTLYLVYNDPDTWSN